MLLSKFINWAENQLEAMYITHDNLAGNLFLLSTNILLSEVVCLQQLYEIGPVVCLYMYTLILFTGLLE